MDEQYTQTVQVYALAHGVHPAEVEDDDHWLPDVEEWLAEHDREVAERAWDACWQRIMLTDSEVEAVNPYRQSIEGEQ